MLRILLSLVLTFQLICTAAFAYVQSGGNDAKWDGIFAQSIVQNGQLTLGNVLEGALDGAITSAASSAVYGTDFADGLKSSVLRNIVSLGLADAQLSIGRAGLDEGSIPHALLHGIAGCAAAELSGADCAASAAAGITQSVFAGTTGEVERHFRAEELTNRAELIGAFAAFVFSKGEADNVSIGAEVSASGFQSNALCGGLCVAALLAAAAVGEGDIAEGVELIGEGDHLLGHLAGAAGEKGLAFANKHYPDQTEYVLGKPAEVGKLSNTVVTYVDDATGNTVSGAWNSLSPETQNRIKGGFTVATFAIPAASAGKLSGVVRGAPNNGLLWGSWNDYPKVTVNGREYAQIGNRQYSRHAVDRMQPSGLGTPLGADGPGRNVTPNMVEDVIANGTPTTTTVNGVPRTVYNGGNVSVVTENGGRTIVTILRNSSQ